MALFRGKPLLLILTREIPWEWNVEMRWGSTRNTSKKIPLQNTYKTVGFGQRPRQLHNRYTRTGAFVLDPPGLATRSDLPAVPSGPLGVSPDPPAVPSGPAGVSWVLRVPSGPSGVPLDPPACPSVPWCFLGPTVAWQ